MEKDNHWPLGLIKVFDTMTKNPGFESRYYGPYDKMLNYCFGNGFDYVVSPQHQPNTKERDSIDFVVHLIVTDDKGRPVMFLEVKDDSWFSQPSTRDLADRQIRDRYNSVIHQCPLPKMYSISALGTMIQIYEVDKTIKEILPTKPARPPTNFVLPEDYMSEFWSINILSQEGFETMKNIVSWIKSQKS